MRTSFLVALMSLALACSRTADDKHVVDKKLDALEKQLRALGYSEEEIKEQVENARKKNEPKNPDVDKKLAALEKQLKALGFSEKEIKEKLTEARQKHLEGKPKPLPKALDPLIEAEKGDLGGIEGSKLQAFFEELKDSEGSGGGEIFEWAKKAAAQNDPRGQYLLATFYAQGIGVEKDLQETEKLLRKAAEQNYFLAQFTLSTLYLEGEEETGVEKDVQEGLKWLRKAAEDNTGAQVMLGLRYLDGDGVEKDVQEGLKWLRKAAELGHGDALHGDALFLLGGHLSQERQNRAAALMYLLLALEIETSKAEANDFLGQLFDFTPEEINEGVRLYSEASKMGLNKDFEFWVKAFLFSNQLMHPANNIRVEDQTRTIKNVSNSLDKLSIKGVGREASLAVEAFSNYLEDLMARKKKQPDVIAAIGFSTLSLAAGDVAGWAKRIEDFTQAERTIVNQEADAYKALTAKLRKARITLSAKHERNFPMFFSIKKD